MEIQKEYSISEEKLIELAKRYSALLSRYIRPLSELNGNLSEDFINSFTDDLILLDTIPDGKTSEALLKTRKQEVENSKTNCMNYFKKVHYFAVEAFAEDTEVIDNFGFNDLSANVKTHTGLITFLCEFEQNCLVYFEELKGAGFTEEYLKELGNLRQDQIIKTSELLKLRKQPRRFTQMRISILNRIWFKVRSIHRAAMLVFDNESKILEEFKIPETPLLKLSKRLMSFFHVSFGGFSY